MTAERSIIIVRFRATADSAADIRTLRWLLKRAWRDFGLKAIGLTVDGELEDEDARRE
jgi:hypothetical protein